MKTPDPLTHIDSEGKARMVDVSAKPEQKRVAVAEGHVFMDKGTLEKIQANTVAKGDVIGIARIAGIQAAKKTSDLIPLCHSLGLTHVDLDIQLSMEPVAVQIRSTVSTTARTGVEMEALTSVTIAALTIYDMCKAVDKHMVIGQVKLVSKTKSPISAMEQSK